MYALKRLGRRYGTIPLPWRSRHKKNNKETWKIKLKIISKQCSIVFNKTCLNTHTHTHTHTYIYIYIYIPRNYSARHLLELWALLDDSNILSKQHETSYIGLHGTGAWMWSWCSGYRRRKWTRWPELKSWMKPFTFHIALILWIKVWIQQFFSG